jgi:hypothetical protein
VVVEQLPFLSVRREECVHAGSRTEIKTRGDAKAVNGPTLPRSKVGRVGHPPVVMSATFEVYSERSATGGHRRFHRNVGKSML